MMGRAGEDRAVSDQLALPLLCQGSLPVYVFLSCVSIVCVCVHVSAGEREDENVSFQLRHYFHLI